MGFFFFLWKEHLFLSRLGCFQAGMAITSKERGLQSVSPGTPVSAPPPQTHLPAPSTFPGVLTLPTNGPLCTAVTSSYHRLLQSTCTVLLPRSSDHHYKGLSLDWNCFASRSHWNGLVAPICNLISILKNTVQYLLLIIYSFLIVELILMMCPR